MIAVLLLAACGSKLPSASLTVGGASVRAEVAHTYETRQRGLMHRDSLAENTGMLFIYKDSQPRGFWMKNTRIPLSIAYANSIGEIVRIADMTPLDTTRVPSLAPAKYALEMNQGWFERNGVKKGDRIEGIPTDLEVE